MQDLRIRSYKPSDNSVVWELHLLGLAQNGIQADRNDSWGQDLNNIEKIYLKGGVFLVGEYQGELVAMGAFKRINEKTAEIKRMRVNPSYQGKGFGQAILTELEERAKKMGYKKMILDTSKKWLKARKLYEKNGYKKVGQKFISKRYHAIYYEKFLE